MQTIIKNGLVYENHAIHKQDIYIEEGIITAIGGRQEEAGMQEDALILDAEGRFVLPGFIDVHTHGAVGVDVNQADEEGFSKISRFFASQGTTSWLCSILTDTNEKTLWCIREAVRFMKKQTAGAQLAGIHLEGPFLSPEYKGAMPEALLQQGNTELLRTYQEAAGGAVRYMTVSPEVSGVPELIKQAGDMGIRAAIGHSGADYDTAWDCIRRGAVSATHTFNAMKLMHQHFPAISGAVLESDIYCEAICDGRHLHPGTVRILLKAKGPDRVIAVTDSIMAAGMPDGEYTLGVNTIIVKDGDARLRDGVRAGSTLTMINALKNLKSYTGRPLEDLVPLLTENPARMLGIYESTGSIAVGKKADITILDEQLFVTDTMIEGKHQSKILGGKNNAINTNETTSGGC